jgi:hypothetical protein
MCQKLLGYFSHFRTGLVSLGQVRTGKVKLDPVRNGYMFGHVRASWPF